MQEAQLNSDTGLTESCTGATAQRLTEQPDQAAFETGLNGTLFNHYQALQFEDSHRCSVAKKYYQLKEPGNATLECWLYIQGYIYACVQTTVTLWHSMQCINWTLTILGSWLCWPTAGSTPR